MKLYYRYILPCALIFILLTKGFVFPCFATDKAGIAPPLTRIIDAMSFFSSEENKEKNKWYVFENGVEYLFLSKMDIIVGKEKNETTKTEEIKNNLQKSQKNTSSSIEIEVLKFNPQYFDFSLHLASEEQESAKTLASWHKAENLLSAINASMFLPDNITSNGYMRKGAHINNNRVASKLGGFFVAVPKEEKRLPQASILYKDETDFSRFTNDPNLGFLDILDKYSIVIQNFKLLELEDSILYNKNRGKESVKCMEKCMEECMACKDTCTECIRECTGECMQEIDPQTVQNEQVATKWESEKRHAIAAIGEDSEGNILFLFAQNSMSVGEFVGAIRHDTRLNLVRALYLDGGKHAAMTFSLGEYLHTWLPNDSFFLFLMGQLPLPNIIGVREK